MKEITEFLIQLGEHNNRDWFHANKKKYQQALEQFEMITEKLILAIRSFDSLLPEVEAKQCIFRIYRDIRFSNDKTPYKSHFGAYISDGGRKSEWAGYYVHLQPGGAFLAGGVHHPSPETLKMIRKDIYDNPEEFTAIVQDKIFVETFSELTGDKLVRPPKGFPADSPVIDWLKFKSYTVFYTMTDEALKAPDFIDRTTKIFRLMMPLIHFLNYAIQGPNR